MGSVKMCSSEWTNHKARGKGASWEGWGRTVDRWWRVLDAELVHAGGQWGTLKEFLSTSVTQWKFGYDKPFILFLSCCPYSLMKGGDPVSPQSYRYVP
jgi:hypothetical protein